MNLQQFATAAYFGPCKKYYLISFFPFLQCMTDSHLRFNTQTFLPLLLLLKKAKNHGNKLKKGNKSVLVPHFKIS